MRRRPVRSRCCRVATRARRRTMRCRGGRGTGAPSASRARACASGCARASCCPGLCGDAGRRGRRRGSGAVSALKDFLLAPAPGPAPVPARPAAASVGRRRWPRRRCCRRSPARPASRSRGGRARRALVCTYTGRDPVRARSGRPAMRWAARWPRAESRRDVADGCSSPSLPGDPALAAADGGGALAVGGALRARRRTARGRARRRPRRVRRAARRRAGRRRPGRDHARLGRRPRTAASSASTPRLGRPSRAPWRPPVSRRPRASGGRSRGCWRDAAADGQALLLVLGALLAVLIGTLVLGGVAAGIAARGDRQRAADLGALSAARALRAAYPRVFMAAAERPAHLERSEYLALGPGAARDTAGRNGVRGRRPSASPAAAWRRCASASPSPIRSARRRGRAASAEAAAPPAAPRPRAPVSTAGRWPCARATACARTSRWRSTAWRAAARARGVALIVNSGFRGDAEQARLFAAHPDPKWVAPPGHSLHRLGTELDLGPPSAYGWLAAHAERSASSSGTRGSRGTSASRAARAPLGRLRRGGRRRAARRAAGVRPGAVRGGARARGAALERLGSAAGGADLRRVALQPVRALGRGRAGDRAVHARHGARVGLRDPFDAARAIDAQAHLMRDLLGRFAAVPLALAAYNAGPLPVPHCMCIPPIPRRRPTSRASSACSTAPATRSGPARGAGGATGGVTAQAGAAARTGASSTGMPLRIAVPVSGSTSSSSVSTLEFTPACASATADRGALARRGPSRAGSRRRRA